MRKLRGRASIILEVLPRIAKDARSAKRPSAALLRRVGEDAEKLGKELLALSQSALGAHLGPWLAEVSGQLHKVCVYVTTRKRLRGWSLDQGSSVFEAIAADRRLSFAVPLVAILEEGGTKPGPKVLLAAAVFVRIESPSGNDPDVEERTQERWKKLAQRAGDLQKARDKVEALMAAQWEEHRSVGTRPSAAQLNAKQRKNGERS